MIAEELRTFLCFLALTFLAVSLILGKAFPKFATEFLIVGVSLYLFLFLAFIVSSYIYSRTYFNKHMTEIDNKLKELENKNDRR